MPAQQLTLNPSLPLPPTPMRSLAYPGDFGIGQYAQRGIPSFNPFSYDIASRLKRADHDIGETELCSLV